HTKIRHTPIARPIVADDTRLEIATNHAALESMTDCVADLTTKPQRAGAPASSLRDMPIDRRALGVFHDVVRPHYFGPTAVVAAHKGRMTERHHELDSALEAPPRSGGIKCPIGRDFDRHPLFG